ncbi:MAG: Gfo/Idh/MocA family protein [Pirellulales bacterium]
MVRVGIVGIGFMGMMHYLGYQRVKGAKVAAVVSRDAKKRGGDWRGIKGNFGPEGTRMDLAGVKGYSELDELLADPQIDLVDLCLPPALHCSAAIAALKAGKHVLVEKPISLTTAEADRMVRAAKTAGKLLMIAHVLPFFPEFTFAHKAATGGKFGKLLGAHFKRIISDPLWIPDFYDPRAVGGPVVDLHIHDAHFIRLLCGMPAGVSSRGTLKGEVVELFNSQFDCGGPAVSAAGGVIRQQGRPFTHGFEIYLEKATLTYDLAVMADGVRVSPLTVLDNKGKAEKPTLPAGDDVTAFALELTEACRAIKTGQASPLLAGDLARDALVLCHKQTESVKKGKPVKI